MNIYIQTFDRHHIKQPYARQSYPRKGLGLGNGYDASVLLTLVDGRTPPSVTSVYDLPHPEGCATAFWRHL